MDGQRHGLIDHGLRPIMDLHDRFEPDLSALPSARERLDRMCELNVQHTVLRVTQTPVVQDAWTAGHRLLVHGWVYRLEDGIIRNLECSVAGPEERSEEHTSELQSLMRISYAVCCLKKPIPLLKQLYTNSHYKQRT